MRGTGSYERSPDLDLLVACGAYAARAMGQHEANEARARAFFKDLLYGKRDIWGCLTEGLITETEARNAIMARFATWLSDENGVREPSSDTWSHSDLEHRFDVAILGRPAKHEDTSR